MTVAELIAILQKMPQHIGVFVTSPDGFGPEPLESVRQESVSVLLYPDAPGTPQFDPNKYVKQEGVVLR